MFDALNALPVAGVVDAEKVRNQYPHGTKVYARPKDDYLSEGEYTVDFVDDAGQIHTFESGIALIPDIDEIQYVCYRCGKAFDYAPTLSRVDNKSFVCRICGASEALDAAGVKDKEPILDEIREHETL